MIKCPSDWRVRRHGWTLRRRGHRATVGAVILAPLLLVAVPPATSQRTTAPPVVQPNRDMTTALAKEGFAPAPDNMVSLAASCRAAGNYFLVAGDGRVLGVASVLDRCWRRRKVSTGDGITIRRWSQLPAGGRGSKRASTLRAVVITNEAFTLLTFGTDLGTGD